ncbi:uncharacterized protein LOC135415097 [Pseudopipra pipra]|uniref:uncharacterized protein LOC135415097 n=1 Tax=Pseudopipra pipra TaxID=415032 RepID=UPI003139B551
MARDPFSPQSFPFNVFLQPFVPFQEACFGPSLSPPQPLPLIPSFPHPPTSFPEPLPSPQPFLPSVFSLSPSTPSLIPSAPPYLFSALPTAPSSSSQSSPALSPSLTSVPSPEPCFGPSLNPKTPFLIPSHHGQSPFPHLSPSPLVPSLGLDLPSVPQPLPSSPQPLPLIPSFPHSPNHSQSPFPHLNPFPSVSSLGPLVWIFPQPPSNPSPHPSFPHSSNHSQSPFPDLSPSPSVPSPPRCPQDQGFSSFGSSLRAFFHLPFSLLVPSLISSPPFCGSGLSASLQSSAPSLSSMSPLSLMAWGTPAVPLGWLQATQTLTHTQGNGCLSRKSRKIICFSTSTWNLSGSAQQGKSLALSSCM